jgi:hypothetical protein
MMHWRRGGANIACSEATEALKCDEEEGLVHMCDKEGGLVHTCDKEEGLVHTCDKKEGLVHTHDKEEGLLHTCGVSTCHSWLSGRLGSTGVVDLQ